MKKILAAIVSVMAINTNAAVVDLVCNYESSYTESQKELCIGDICVPAQEGYSKELNWSISSNIHLNTITGEVDTGAMMYEDHGTRMEVHHDEFFMATDIRMLWIDRTDLSYHLLEMMYEPNVHYYGQCKINQNAPKNLI